MSPEGTDEFASARAARVQAEEGEGREGLEGKEAQCAVKQPRDRTRLDRMALLHRRSDRLHVPATTDTVLFPCLQKVRTSSPPPGRREYRPRRARAERDCPYLLETREQDGVGSRGDGLVRLCKLALCWTSDHWCVADRLVPVSPEGTDEFASARAARVQAEEGEGREGLEPALQTGSLLDL
jgi:hypothetical protein